MSLSPNIDQLLALDSAISPANRIERLRQGISYRELERLRKELHLTLEEFAQALGISPRTLSRRKDENLLKHEESDRVYRFARVYHHALEVFGSAERVVSWLKRSNAALDGMKPLEVFDTDLGAQLVDELLTRIEYGVYS